jgi:RimJ/RimL family protein N-acetyltransferase
VPLVPPDPALSDGVVFLRPFDLRDADRVGQALRDPEIVRWFGASDLTAEEFIARKERGWQNGTAGAFAICDRGGSLVGQVFVELGERAIAGVGYWLLPAGRGRGHATRAVKLLSGWALAELAVARLEIWHEPGNIASQRVAERSGFIREGLRRSYWLRGDRRIDAVYYSLLPTDRV